MAENKITYQIRSDATFSVGELEQLESLMKKAGFTESRMFGYTEDAGDRFLVFELSGPEAQVLVETEKEEEED